MLAFDDCMTSTHTNVINSDLTLMTSSEFELRLLRRYCKQMNVSWRVFIEGHRFKKNIVVFHIHLLWKVDDLVDRPANLESVGIHVLADLAFETLPIKWAHVLVLSIWRLFLFLSQHPILQALEMDQAYGTSAFACNDQRIVLVLFWAPADSALNLVFSASFTKVLDSLDLLSFFKFLVVELSFTHHDLVTLEVLDSESNSTQFNGVKFLNFVVVFSSFIFERTSN